MNQNNTSDDRSMLEDINSLLANESPENEQESISDTMQEIFNLFDENARQAETIDVEYTTIEQDNEFSEHSDWFAVACRLRQNNRDLIAKVMELEKALAASVEKLQAQKTRSNSANILISQQAEELKSLQEQVNRLLHQLKSAHETNKSQQILIDNLTEKLQVSHQQMAQLEREFSKLQENYTQQSHKLANMEQQLQELNNRLQRQQRHTTEFKVALQECLTSSSDSVTVKEPSQPLIATSTVSKTSSIQPWSVQLDTPKNVTQTENKKYQNWPSPLIHPLNSEKKSKPRTKVELPIFSKK